MFKLTSAACIMLAFAGSVRALDTAPPAALTLESVPPPSLSQQAVPLATPREGALAPSVGESEEPRARPVIVVRLQNADPIMRQADENMAALQADIDFENRRLDRLARFTELAVRNARTHSVGPQAWLQEKRVELGPAVNVLASNDGYGLGLGWPLHY